MSEQETQKPQPQIIVQKPSLVNAILPLAIKYGFASLIITGILYAVSLGISNFVSFVFAIPMFVGIFLVITFIPLIGKIFVLWNTKYYFHQTHITSEFKFIIVRRHSVPYHNITNIRSTLNVWDRISGAGDLTLNTAEDREKDLVLKYLKKPHEIEKALYGFMHRQRK